MRFGLVLIAFQIFQIGEAYMRWTAGYVVSDFMYTFYVVSAITTASMDIVEWYNHLQQKTQPND